MTDNATGSGGAPSKEQVSSAEDFLNNGDFSQSPKLSEGFKDILDNKQNFNFEVKDIGGGQYQAKASSVYQQDDPNFQKAVSVDLNEKDIKNLNDLNQGRVKEELNKSQSTQNSFLSQDLKELKKVSLLSPAISNLYDAIIRDSGRISEEKENNLQSESGKKLLAEKIFNLRSLIKEKDENLEKRNIELFREAELEKNKILSHLIEIEKKAGLTSESNMVMAQNQAQIQNQNQNQPPQANTTTNNNNFKNSQLSKKYPSKEKANEKMQEMAKKAESRNDDIKLAKETNDYSALSKNDFIAEKNRIKTDLNNPENAESFRTDEGKSVKQELIAGLSNMDFTQRLGAWERAGKPDEQSGQKEHFRIVQSVQGIYDDFKQEMQDKHESLKKSDDPLKQQEAKELEAKFKEMKTPGDMLKFSEGEKYKGSLEKMYEKGSDGNYNIKDEYKTLDKSININKLDSYSSVDYSHLDITPRSEQDSIFGNLFDEPDFEPKAKPETKPETKPENKDKENISTKQESESEKPKENNKASPNQPDAKPGDMKSKIEELGKKRDDFANKVKAIGTAEGKEGKFKAVMDAYKAGKELRKEGKKLDKEMKGKKGKSSSKGGASSQNEDEEDIGSLYDALMAIINGMKSLRKDVRTLAEQNQVKLPEIKKAEQPSAKDSLAQKYDNVVKKMEQGTERLNKDLEKINDKYENKIKKEESKSNPDAKKIESLTNKQNEKLQQTYDNHRKERAGLEKQADGLKDKMTKQDSQATNAQQDNKASSNQPNAKSGDMKSKIDDLGKKRDDFANKVKAIGTAEGKEGKFKAVMDAYKAGKELRKEGKKLDKEVKGKKGKSSSKGGASSQNEDEEDIGSLYDALMAIINGMKSLRKDVKTLAEQNQVNLPKPKMSNEDKQFMKEYPEKRNDLKDKHDNTLKQMTDVDNKFKADSDKLNKDFDKKIAGERSKNEGDPSKTNALINQKNEANKQLYDNYLKDRGVKEKEADGLKDQIKKLDDKADNIRNPNAQQDSKKSSNQSELKMSNEDKRFMKEYPEKRNDLKDKHDNTLKQMTDVDNKFKADSDKLNKDFDKKIADERSKNEGDPSKTNALINQKNEANKQLYDNYLKDRGIIEKQADGLKDQMKQLDDKVNNLRNPSGTAKPEAANNPTAQKASGPETKANQPANAGPTEDQKDLAKNVAKDAVVETAKSGGQPEAGVPKAIAKNAGGIAEEAKASTDNKDTSGAKPKPGMSNVTSSKMDLNLDNKQNQSSPETSKPKAGMSNLKSGRMDLNLDDKQNQPSPEKAKPGTDDSKKELGKKIAQDSVKETMQSGGQPEVGVAKAVAKNAGGIAEEVKASTDNKNKDSKGDKPEAKPSMPGGETTGTSAAKSSGPKSSSGGESGGPKSSGPSGGSKASGIAASVVGGAVDGISQVGQGLSELGEMAKKLSSRSEDKKAQGAGPENNTPNSSAGAGGPQKSGESKSAGLTASFQGVADTISQAGSALKSGQGGDANDVGNGLSQAITQLTQGLSQLGDMGKKLSSGGADDKKAEGAGPSKPKPSKGGGGSKASQEEEDAVPGQEGQELADALKAIGDGIKEMGQTISKMSGKDGAKEGGKKPAKSGGGKEEEDEKKLEPGDPSAAINAVVEGINDLIKQIGDLGKQLIAGAGMQGPGGGGAPKGPGGDMQQGGPSGGMQGGPGGGAGGGQSPSGGGMDMNAMGGEAAGGMGAPPIPKDKDHFKNEEGKTKDTDEIGKEVGKDFAKEMADPANGGQPEIAAIKVLIKDGPALMEAAKSKAEETALAPVGIAKDVANSMNSELEKAGNPTTQTYDPANQAAAEESKKSAQKQSEAPKQEPKPEPSAGASKNKMSSGP